MAQNLTKSGDIYVPQIATLVRKERLTELETFFEIQLESNQPLGHRPGQFVMVSLPGLGEAPISVSSRPVGNTFELVVRRIGRLTTAMHRMEVGDKLGIRGPFGTDFPVNTFRGQDVLFICGGIGLVPVRGAILEVLANRAAYGHVAILYGTRGPSERLFVDDLARWKAREDVTFLETVDRGSDAWDGNVGVITTLIPKIEIAPERTAVVVCGPPIMYKFVLMELYQQNVPKENIYVSLERRMKCGVGKCGHCQINGLYTCLDGPVFRYADVSDVREAI
ncbi:MAG: oxidoreductase [Kiritimatiellaeota bacterium]|nr:oxidoreductase [Kiritimatiellota bacterium]